MAVVVQETNSMARTRPVKRAHRNPPRRLTVVLFLHLRAAHLARMELIRWILLKVELCKSNYE
jgi:hypothetical protein